MEKKNISTIQVESSFAILPSSVENRDRTLELSHSFLPSTYTPEIVEKSKSAVFSTLDNLSFRESGSYNTPKLSNSAFTERGRQSEEIKETLFEEIVVSSDSSSISKGIETSFRHVPSLTGKSEIFKYSIPYTSRYNLTHSGRDLDTSTPISIPSNFTSAHTSVWLHLTEKDTSFSTRGPHIDASVSISSFLASAQTRILLSSTKNDNSITITDLHTNASASTPSTTTSAETSVLLPLTEKYTSITTIVPRIDASVSIPSAATPAKTSVLLPSTEKYTLITDIRSHIGASVSIVNATEFAQPTFLLPLTKKDTLITTLGPHTDTSVSIPSTGIPALTSVLLPLAEKGTSINTVGPHTNASVSIPSTATSALISILLPSTTHDTSTSTIGPHVDAFESVPSTATSALTNILLPSTIHDTSTSTIGPYVDSFVSIPSTGTFAKTGFLLQLLNKDTSITILASPLDKSASTPRTSTFSQPSIPSPLTEKVILTTSISQTTSAYKLRKNTMNFSKQVSLPSMSDLDKTAITKSETPMAETVQTTGTKRSLTASKSISQIPTQLVTERLPSKNITSKIVVDIKSPKVKTTPRVSVNTGTASKSTRKPTTLLAKSKLPDLATYKTMTKSSTVMKTESMPTVLETKDLDLESEVHRLKIAVGVLSACLILLIIAIIIYFILRRKRRTAKLRRNFEMDDPIMHRKPVKLTRESLNWDRVAISNRMAMSESSNEGNNNGYGAGMGTFGGRVVSDIAEKDEVFNETRLSAGSFDDDNETHDLDNKYDESSRFIENENYRDPGANT